MKYSLLSNIAISIPIVAAYSVPHPHFNDALALRDLNFNRENDNLLFSRGGGSQQPGPSSDTAAANAILKQKSISLTTLHQSEDKEPLIQKNSQPPSDNQNPPPQFPPIKRIGSQGSVSPILGSPRKNSPREPFVPFRPLLPLRTDVPPPQKEDDEEIKPVFQRAKLRLGSPKAGTSKQSGDLEGISIQSQRSQSTSSIGSLSVASKDKTTCEKLKDDCKKIGGVIAKHPATVGMTTAALGSTLITAGASNQYPLAAAGAGALCAGLWCYSAAKWVDAFSENNHKETMKQHRRDLGDGFDMFLDGRSLRLDKRSVGHYNDIADGLYMAREVKMDADPEG